MADRTGAPDKLDQGDLQSDTREIEISFKPYIDAVWESRRLIRTAILALTALFALFIIGAWFWAPSESVSTVRFRLQFDGAAQGKYPNDTEFSPSEILAVPIVTEVYNANDLQRFGPLPAFKDAMFIQHSNPQLALLAYEYQARLSDSRLSPMDRARIEEEFRTRSETLVDPSFALSMRRSERFSQMPSTLAQKVLTDTLNTWATHAEARKGVLRYQVPILSKNILTAESLAQGDFLVVADRLRAEANRVLNTADQVADMPGAMTVRTANTSASLAEIRARLDDAIRFEIVPLIGVIRGEGLASDPRQFAQYASNMVFQLRLDKQVSSARAQALQQSLRNYVALNVPRMLEAPPAASGAAPSTESQGVIPQVSDSFVDRIQQMSVVTQKGEMEYRRRITDQIISETRQVAVFDRELLYYEELTQRLTPPMVPSPERAAAIRRQITSAFDVVSRATSDLHDLYQEVSTQNLNPTARLYVLTGPFTRHVEHSVALRRFLLIYGFSLVMAIVLIPLVMLLRAAVRRRARTTATVKA